MFNGLITEKYDIILILKSSYKSYIYYIIMCLHISQCRFNILLCFTDIIFIILRICVINRYAHTTAINGAVGDNFVCAIGPGYTNAVTPRCLIPH